MRQEGMIDRVNDLTAQSLIDGAIAIGLGVFIGLEREHSEGGSEVAAEAAPAGSSKNSEHLGVRTFALVALFGWVCAMLEPSAHGISLVGLAVAGGLIGLQYVRPGVRSGHHDRGRGAGDVRPGPAGRA